MTNLTNYWVYCVKHINVKTQDLFSDGPGSFSDVMKLFTLRVPFKIMLNNINCTPKTEICIYATKMSIISI